MFYQGFDLEQRVRPNHPLRRVKQLVDFDFLYQEVAHTYGGNGQVSVPPPVILKWMLLLVLYNVRSERELMATLPERLDWLWFLGFDLDDAIPDHSVLSKARRRWGAAAFQHFFERIVCQCVAAGLVEGSKIFMDSSLIQADAASSSVLNLTSLKSQLNRHYKELEARLAEPPADGHGPGPDALSRTRVSTTDPEASLVSKGKVRSQLSYKVHRAVDGHREVITARRRWWWRIPSTARSTTIWPVTTGASGPICLPSTAAGDRTGGGRRPSPMTPERTSTSVRRGSGSAGGAMMNGGRPSSTSARPGSAGRAPFRTSAPGPAGAAP